MIQSKNAAEWFREKRDTFSGQLVFNEPMSRHTYYRIGGLASVFAIPKSLEDLKLLSEGIRETGINAFILGMGSNLLVSDSGFQGLIIKTTRLNLEMSAVAVNDANVAHGAHVPLSPTLTRIRVGGSVAMSSLLRKAAQEGWGGLEFLTGVPGSVGGAVWMNAGTHLGETQDRLKRVEVYSLFEKSFSDHPLIFEEGSLKYEYRKNLFLSKGHIVFATEWDVIQDNPTQVKALIDQTLARRKATQPIDLPSCGSVFKNPKSSNLSSWQVMDKLGLRGYRIGDAQFSEKHCNFIVNHGQAKAIEVRALIELAKSRALNELGVTLEEEVIFLGDSSTPTS